MKHREKMGLQILIALCLLCTLVLGGCSSKKENLLGGGRPAELSSEQASEPAERLVVSDLGVMHEEEFGGVYVDISIEAFNEQGFAYGDSVNVTFSNGFYLDDLPYYNGYYSRNGEPLVVAYPGYPYIKVCINSGADLWDVAALSETDYAEISLAEPAKYLDIQEVRNLEYLDDRERFESDEMFGNFRCVNVTGIRENVLYRAASPCNNEHNRAPYVNDLIETAGVACIVNLADTEEKITNYIHAEDFDSPYFYSLYESGKVILLGLNMNYGSEVFRTKLVKGLTEMASYDGPYLVHCTEGKDRTGFVCILLEALCGADFEEIKDDYMTTYYNYYEITEESDPVKYDAIVENLFVPMFDSIVNKPDVYLTATYLSSEDLASAAERYLLESGMDQATIDLLKSRLQ